MSFPVPLLLEISLKATCLLLVAGLLALLLRRWPARSRLALWTGALFGTLLLPGLGPLVPTGWRPAAPLIAAPSSLERTTETPARWAVQSLPVSSPAAVEALEAAPRFDGSALLGILWLTGAALVLLRLLVSHVALRRLGQRSGRVERADWSEALRSAAEQASYRRPLRLLVSTDVASPMTWGTLRPTILLPKNAVTWSPERLRLVLLHELVHVRRRDWLIRLFARLACAVYWFHPMIWLAARQLRIEQELACDDEVLATGTRPSSYAEHLLAIARTASWKGYESGAALCMARRSQMETRLMSILDATRSRRRSVLLLPLLVLLAGLVPLLAAVEPWAESEGEPSSEARPAEQVAAELELLEKQLHPAESELRALEEAMRPHEQQMRAVEVEMRAREELARALEKKMAPLHDRLADLQLQLEPHERRLAELAVRLRPEEEELQALESELQREMQLIQEEMEPIHRALEEAHLEMEPAYRRLEAQLRELEPEHRALAATHRQIEASQREMEAVHRSMEATHRQMEALHRELEAALRREIGTLLEREIGPVAEAGTSFDRATEAVLQAASIHHDQGLVHLRVSVPELREVLSRQLDSVRSAPPDTFSAAVERAIEALQEIELGR